MKLGFIGLGDQGGPIPHKLLQAGFDVAVWARRPDVTRAYAEAGAQVAPDVATLAVECDWIGVCVFDDAGVREVCGQLLANMSHGASIIIHSTIHPDTCRALAADASERGVHLVDAPVSGGRARAAEGKLTIMVGADEAAFAISESVLQTYGDVIVRVGEPGAGQVAKLINNALMVTHAAIARAAIQTGEQLGLDPASLVRVINSSSGRSYGFEVFGATGMAGFARVSALLDKDVSLLSDVSGYQAPMQEAVEISQRFLADLHAETSRRG